MSERDLFIAALEQSEPERSGWLAQACAGDAALRERVEILLRAHDQASRFLVDPAIRDINSESFSAKQPTLSAASLDDRDSFGDDLPAGFLSHSDKPGELGTLGEYEVLEIVGRGGMSIVLKAFEPKLHRLVAIKVMAGHLAASSAARRRFEREAKAVAAVRNEHVVAIHAVEPDGPTPYLVMEFIGGVSLQERLERRGPLELKEILRIGQQAALGLAAAHAQGLVHRDVKPANILLENGVERVKLTDFGLARAADDASITRSGAITGTPNYMSPEQADGQPVDHRSDLFSLGSVLYAMATGYPPFRADGLAAVLKRVAADTPRSIREINPDMPDWFDAIIQKLHAKDPADRFQSAKEVAELLGQHLAHLQQPTVVPRPNRIELKSRRGDHSLWRYSGLIVLFLVFFPIIFMFLLNGLEPAIARILGRLERAVPGAFFFLLGVGSWLMIGISHRRLMRKLKATLPADEFRVRRRRGRIAIAIVGIMCSSPFVASGLWIWFEQRLKTEPVSNQAQLAINWNRDLIKRVTIWQDYNNVQEYSGQTEGVATVLEPGRYTIRGFKDDRQVYFEELTLGPGDHHGIWIFEQPQSPEYAEFSIESRDPSIAIEVRSTEHVFQLGPTGNKAVTQGLRVGKTYRFGIARGDHVLHVEDITLQTGEHREVRIPPIVEWDRRIELKPKSGDFPGDVTQMQIAPDRSAIAAGRFGGPIIVFDAVTGKERFTIPRPRSHCTAFGFTPDSKRIAYQILGPGGDHLVRFLDSTTGQTIGPEFKPAMASILNGRALAFSPDGKRLAVGSTENFGQDSRFFRSRIFRWEATGDNDWTELPVTTWQDGIIKAMRFSPNGVTLTAIADQAREWNWTAATNLPRGGGAMDVLASGPNSRAFGGWNDKDKTSTITVMSRNAYLPAMPKWPSPLGCLAVSPDGALVAAGNKSIVAYPGGQGADLPWEKRAAIRVWDAKTGVEKAVLLGHSSWILDLAFSPGGKELISTSNDGTVRIWKLQ